MGRRTDLILDDRKIKELYLTDKYTCQDLAEQFGCTNVAIRNHLVVQGVKLRPRGKWKFKYPKYPFSGDLEEEAYLMGFRIGDLHVVRESKKSRSIKVRCHTTQKVQIDVCKELFKRYSTVVIKKLKDQTFQVSCYLDLSFEFLMKKDRVPRKYLNNNKAAWAFFAGYMDAEGNIIINQGRARLKIDSYDFHVLTWIHEFLLKQGINSKLRRIAEKGSIRSIQYKTIWNGDLWRLNVNASESLNIVLNSLMPYLKHETRINHTKIALENIKKRQHAKH